MPSAEGNLSNLFQGFDVHIFDPDNDKSGITSQRMRGRAPKEIDAVLIKDNILIIANIYGGTREAEISSKIKPFFRDLSYFNNIDQLNLKVANIRTRRGRENKEFIDNLKRRISTNNYEYIVIKLVFCPNLYVSPDKISLKSDESVIDKKLFRYFEYILETVDYEHMERELFYFLKIKMRLIELQKGSRVGDEPELTGNFHCIETDLGTNQKMYSAWVSVNDIMKYIQVLRIANEYDVKSFQRMVNREMLKKISDHYLDKHETFPNNIILALNPELYDPGRVNHFTSNHNKIKFYKEFGSLIIIDGQHRLLAHLLNKSRDMNKPILINVILFLNKEKAYDEMAELFYIINTKQKRLASLVSLKIRSKIEPTSIEGMWYNIFEGLNKIRQRDNYLHNKISFEEKEIREDSDKISITSIIKYSGLKRITNGTKKRGKEYLGLKNLGENCVSGNYTLINFYENFIRKYFSIIGEILNISGISISPRDLGGLLKLVIHFINDNRTKDLFRQLSEERGTIPDGLKRNIKNYFSNIPFSDLSILEYAAQHWAAMEGFFLGCVRKSHKGFGFGPLLSKKGELALNKGKRW